MYFSSGYAKAENGERYTFVWNEKKFPHAEGFIQNLRNRGYRICCNVKPGILLDHPWYDELAKDGVFIPDNDGSPLRSYYWGNSASFVDFSRKEGFDWWVKSLKKYILEREFRECGMTITNSKSRISLFRFRLSRIFCQ